MNIKKILIEDYYLNYSYATNLNLERRFFVNIEWEENLSFIILNEQTSVFSKYGIKNIFTVEKKNIEEMKKEMPSDGNQKSIQYFEIDLEKDNLFEEIKNKIKFSTENWNRFVKESSLKKNILLTAETEKNQLEIFNQVNKQIEKFWQNICENKLNMNIEILEVQDMPKLEEFLKYIEYSYLSSKLANKKNSKSIKI